MTTLKQLQEQFQASILNDETSIEQYFEQPKDMSVTDRVKVYKNAYIIRLIEALEDDFPALRKLLGNESFSALCRDYFKAFPSHYFSLHDVGQHMEAFLKTYPQSTLYYEELSRLEWALSTSLLEEDTPILSLNDLATLSEEDWPGLKFRLEPSVKILSFKTNAPIVWRQIMDEGISEPEFTESDQVTQIMVWRYDREMFFRELSDIEFHMIEGLQKNLNFADLCEFMLELLDEEQVVSNVFPILQNWINEGILLDFNVPI